MCECEKIHIISLSTDPPQCIYCKSCHIRLINAAENPEAKFDVTVAFRRNLQFY